MRDKTKGSLAGSDTALTEDNNCKVDEKSLQDTECDSRKHMMRCWCLRNAGIRLERTSSLQADVLALLGGRKVLPMEYRKILCIGDQTIPFLSEGLEVLIAIRCGQNLDVTYADHQLSTL